MAQSASETCSEKAKTGYVAKNDNSSNAVKFKKCFKNSIELRHINTLISGDFHKFKIMRFSQSVNRTVA